MEANCAKPRSDSGIAEAPKASAAHIELPLRHALSVAALQPGESLLCGVGREEASGWKVLDECQVLGSERLKRCGREVKGIARELRPAGVARRKPNRSAGDAWCMHNNSGKNHRPGLPKTHRTRTSRQAQALAFSGTATAHAVLSRPAAAGASGVDFWPKKRLAAAHAAPAAPVWPSQ